MASDKLVCLKLYMLCFITEPLSSNNKKLLKSKTYYNVSTYRDCDVITRQVFWIRKGLCYDKNNLTGCFMVHSFFKDALYPHIVIYFVAKI